jgi:alanine-glyoxylate transaminase/serine-glyoxylate transaminase/serine-pyruvate transaminase
MAVLTDMRSTPASGLSQGHEAGRAFLQIPGPSPIPDRVLAAMSRQVIDHRGERFARLAQEILAGLRALFRTESRVFVFPGSGTGAWEAAFVNLLVPGDQILVYETGHFATVWASVANRLGYQAEMIAADWRDGLDPSRIEERLRADRGNSIKAVCIVHNETSTGTLASVPDVRRAINAAAHPALLLVDTISGLGSTDYRHDEWGVDVSIGASQKGLMLPPGLCFNAVSTRALSLAGSGGSPRSYWSWSEMTADGAPVFPYTPAINLLFGLAEAIKMLNEEGLSNVFARHARLAAGVHAAADAWGLEIWCRAAQHRSPVLTTLAMPPNADAEAFRALASSRFNLTLGAGLSKLKGRAFRIGHLGDTDDLTIVGALAGVEMALELAGIPYRAGGVQAAMRRLVEIGQAGF